MGTGSENSNMPVIAESRALLDRLKMEVAEDLNLMNFIEAKHRGYAGNLTTRDTGAVGGHMVKRMIRAAQEALKTEARAEATAQAYAQATASTEPDAAKTP